MAPDRPKLVENRDREDSSFHNNRVVVDAWINRLKKHSTSSRALEELLKITTQMMTREPRSRLLTWEAEIDLYNIQGTGISAVVPTIKGSLCIQPPLKSTYHGRVSNGAQTPLHRAALKEDRQRMIDLLDLGWPMFVQDEAGKTALDIIKRSESKQFRESFRTYLGPGSVATSVDQGAALLQAVDVGDTVTIRRLLNEGVNPLTVNSEGLSSLSLAITRGHVSAIEGLLRSDSHKQLLLKNSANGETALHLAVILGRRTSLEILLQHGTDLEDRQHDGKTALSLAVELKCEDSAESLLTHTPSAQVFTQCNKGDTPIHKALGFNPRLMDLLLDAEDSTRCLEHRNYFGETPVWLAVHHEDFRAFRMLKERGASLRTANHDHDNLLHLISRQKLYDLLIENLSVFDPSDVEGRNRWNDTPLTIADRNGHKEIAGLLQSFYTGAEFSNVVDVLEVPSSKPKLFYTLGSGQEWIREDSEGYWRHLTYASWNVYDQIWSFAADHGARRLSFGNFTKQFNPSDPRPETIEYVWKRLLSLPSSDVGQTSHPKPLIFAILYMLHIERFSSERPRGDTDQPGEVKTKRREILKLFDHWVPCDCRRKCPTEWNFANDLGVYRSEPQVAEKCKVIQIVGLHGRKTERNYKIWKGLLDTWKEGRR